LEAAPFADRLDEPPMAATTVICRVCGLVYTNPRPTAQAITAFYEKEYRVMYAGTDDPAAAAARMAIRAKHIRATLGPVSGKRILEVGSATGETLVALREHGADVYGIEPTVSYAEHSRRSGVTTHVGGYETYAPKQDFDMIILSHVLEHLPQPMDALRTFRSWLATGGRMYVEVPNITSYPWLEIAHLSGFVPRTLRNILLASGFGIERLWTFGQAGWRGLVYREYYLAAIVKPAQASAGENADWRAIVRQRERTLNSIPRRLIGVPRRLLRGIASI
jgi:SAM-dependent methyltransferase